MHSIDKYREYFDIDEKYFPCIDDAAINAGAPWDNTYPHSTFIKLLTEMERALARQNNGKTLWIEGPYGTGVHRITSEENVTLLERLNLLEPTWDEMAESEKERQ